MSHDAGSGAPDLRQRESFAERWRLFATLVLEGQRVDWKHSLVIVLVITGMFSTPLVLGSIRNRVYLAVKEQIEKENNARQIALHPVRQPAANLDTDSVAALEAQFPGVRAVGNHKLVVSVEGPERADLVTAQSWARDDPRRVWLGVEPRLTRALALDGVMVSDGLGRLLYGEAWDSLWRDGAFTGPPLTVRINELTLAPRFHVVARRTLPGLGLYLSPTAAHGLRRYTLGFGAPALGLPVNEGLLEHALPKPMAERCTVLLGDGNSGCDAAARSLIERRFAARQWPRLPGDEGRFGDLVGWRSLRVALTEVQTTAARTEVRVVAGDCASLLAPHLVDICRDARVIPELEMAAVLAIEDAMPRDVIVVGAPPAVAAALPGVAELRDRYGSALPADDVLELVAAAELGLSPGEPVMIRVGETDVPARIRALYACESSADVPCPMFANLLLTARLRDLAAGTVALQSTEPLVFVPTDIGETFDEVLVYAPSVEDVEPLAASLSAAYPGMSVRYNVTALAKLARQDARLATLFSLTMVLAAMFIVLALGALTRLDVERRKRQLAQLLILGKSRRFVRRLIVGELLMLTLLASALAAGLTAGLCVLARALLVGEGREASPDFAIIVSAMGLDLVAFVQVTTVVLACTWIVALASAYGAARTDPLTLLD